MIRPLAIKLLQLIRRLGYYAAAARLKLIGADVAWSARIHPRSVVELSGGYIKIGDRTYVDHGVVLRAMGGHITIGSDCNINAYSFLSGAGGLKIDDYVMIGSHVSIYASNHVFESTSVPMSSQGLTTVGINIQSDVWVGTGVRVLDGIVIGTGSVLAAGAVVTRSTDPYSINAGVPSRPIDYRSHP